MKVIKTFFLVGMLLSFSNSDAFELVFSEQTEHGIVSAYVKNPASPTEKWQFEAITNFGDSLTIEYSVANNSALLYSSELVGDWFQTSNSASEPVGWSEYTSGELVGFYSHSNGTISDPFFGGGPGDPPPGFEIRGAGLDERAIAMRELALSLFELSSMHSNDRGYLGCVGSVAGAIGSTIFGAQHHSQNVRGHRLGQVSSGAVRASGVALGAVVVGGVAVSAGVCLGVFFSNN